MSSSGAFRLAALPFGVDPAPDAWPLLPSTLVDSISSDAAHTVTGGTPLVTRLDRVAASAQQRRKNWPKLPAEESWVYATANTAQRRRQEKELAIAAERAGATLTKRQQQIQYQNGGEELTGINDDDADDDADMYSNSDDDSTAAASSVTSVSGGVAASHPPPLRSRRDATPDPLYGPELDASDEAWVASRHSSGLGSLPHRRTDAFLSCPACFAPLCVDCQRHDTRHTMFRAMFVLENVLVDRGRSVRPEAGSDDDTKRNYYAALCRVCKSHVGVQDEDEVYHFFHVIESQG